MAMISLAEVMSKPVSRGVPFLSPPMATCTVRSARSFMSNTRRQVMRAGSNFGSLPWKMCASRNAAQRLWALVTAWKSPVRWRFISSGGTTWLYPPPAAPPLMPNTGPIDGWRITHTVRLPMRLRAWLMPTVCTVLPSPSGVGEMAVTTTYLPGLRVAGCLSRSSFTLALALP